MSFLQTGVSAEQPTSLPPPVDDPARMTAPHKVAAVAKVRCLEHALFDGERIRRALSRDQAEHLVAQINELRTALGWLEVDLDGKWRWPH